MAPSRVAWCGVVMRWNGLSDVNFSIGDSSPTSMSMSDDDDKAASGAMLDNGFTELDETCLVKMYIRLVQQPDWLSRVEVGGQEQALLFAL